MTPQASRKPDSGSSSTAAIGFEAEFELRLNVVAELEAVDTTNLQHVTRLWQAVPQKAFTGELE